jgi:serine/threonine protein kinase/WD40 repeat protein
MNELTPDVKSVFGRALALASAGERAAYLDGACAGHPALRAEVDALLRAHGRAGDFLNTPEPSPEAAVTGSLRPAAGQPGALIAGRYKLLQQIGEGGMGSVWMADQTEPVRRRVAVKLVHADRGASRTILSRFEAERQAIALMSHPNIAKLLDAGTTDAGQPFFVMELVKGVPLTDFCDAHKLSVPDRLGQFRQICSAVHHAHQKGVIHRDLKPTNILVESHDGQPVPKVIDFGLAKATTGMQLTEHTLFTAFGTVAGTPLYMAPEQATFNAVDVDSRADIYALGVILYELLAGSTPIQRDTLKTAALDEMLRLVREQEPPPPSSRISTSQAGPSIAANRQAEPAKLGRFVRGELDWIVMKALAKERDRRYESATALAADVGRFLAQEPVTAGPPSQWYRLQKFVRRNKGRVTAAAAAAILLVAGVVGTSLGMLAANQAAARAVAEEEKAIAALTEKEEALGAETLARRAETAAKTGLQTSLAAQRQTAYDLTVAQAQKALNDSDQPRASELLESCPEDLRRWEWNYLTRQFDRNAVVLRPSFGPGRFGRDAIYLTPDSKRLLVLTEYPLGLYVQGWDTGPGKKTFEKALPLRQTNGPRRWYTISPDRKLVAVWEPPSNFFRGRGESLKPVAPKQTPASARAVHIYDLQTGDRVGELRGHTSWVYHVIFSDDSKQVVTGGSDQTLRFWDTGGRAGMVLKGHTKAAALPLAFTPDGRSLISAGRDLKTPLPPGTAAVWKPDSLIAERDEWFVWDLATQTPRTRGDLAHVPLDHFIGFDPTLAVSPDGRFAILPAWISSAVVDLATGQRAPLPENEQPLGFRHTGRSSVVLMLDSVGIVTPVNLTDSRDIVVRHRLSIPTPDGSNGIVMSNGTPPWSWNLSRDGRILAIGRDREKKTVIVDTAIGGEIGFVPDKRSAYLPGHQPFVGGRYHERVIAHDGSFVTTEQADQRKPHARGERERPGVPVRVDTHQGLEQRGGELEGERDEADLREGQLEGRLQQRVDRGDERLDQVVKQVRKAERHQDRKCGRLRRLPRASDGLRCRLGFHQSPLLPGIVRHGMLPPLYRLRGVGTEEKPALRRLADDDAAACGQIGRFDPR